jgi:hypothetical protein
MGKSNNLTDFLTDVADAIRAKKGTTAKINPQDFSSEIASISTGGGDTINNQEKSVDITENGTTEVVADAGFTGLSKVSINVNVPTSGGGGGGESTCGGGSDVRFLDYDGTLLYSFSKDDFLALSALPDLPTRAGLTCQGWNYTLEDAQEYVTSYGVLDIGATYITDDGKTRLYIKIAAEGRMTVPLYFSQTVANGVTIDWGDGSATETLSGTGNLNTAHTYSEIGEYTISLNPADGCTLGLGHSSSYCVMGSTGNNGRVYINMLQAVEIGKNVTRISSFCNCYSLASVVIPQSVTSIGSPAFSSCYSLASIVIPSSVTSIGSSAFSNCYSLASVVIPQSVTSIIAYAFNYCYSLASIVIPSSVTSIGSSAFSNCYSLASVVIPQSVTSIIAYAFSNCYSLASVVIPQSVTSIGSSAFSKCYGMAFYDFRASKSVPTLSNTNAFDSIPSDCKIVVPDSLYDTWIAATNWSTHASNIIKASEYTE